MGPRTVCADDRELVAALEAELLQPGRKRANLVQHLAPGPRLPDAEVLVAHRHAAAARLRVLNQKLRNGIRTGALVGHDAVPPCRRGSSPRGCSPSPPFVRQD